MLVIAWTGLVFVLVVAVAVPVSVRALLVFPALLDFIRVVLLLNQRQSVCAELDGAGGVRGQGGIHLQEISNHYLPLPFPLCPPLPLLPLSLAAATCSCTDTSTVLALSLEEGALEGDIGRMIIVTTIMAMFLPFIFILFLFLFLPLSLSLFLFLFLCLRVVLLLMPVKNSKVAIMFILTAVNTIATTFIITLIVMNNLLTSRIVGVSTSSILAYA